MLSCFRLLPSVCLHDHMDYQAFLSMGFSRQEYWSGLPCLHPGYLADPGIKPVSLMSPALAGMFFTTNSTREALTNKSVSSVTHSCPTLQPHGLQHTRLPCLSPSPGVYSDSHPLSQWCHPTISSSVIPLSFHLQSFPASGSFQISQFFASGNQSIWVLASASIQFSSVAQSCPTLCDPRTTAHQASLSITNSQSLLKLMSIQSVMPSNHLILCHSLLLLPSIFSSIKVFSMSQFFTSGSQTIGASSSASVLPMNIQDWFPLGWTGFISLQSKGQPLQDTINVPFLFQWPQVSFCQQQPKEAQQIQLLNESMSTRIKNTKTSQSKHGRKGMKKQRTQERNKSNLINQKKFNDRKEVYTQCQEPVNVTDSSCTLLI